MSLARQVLEAHFGERDEWAIVSAVPETLDKGYLLVERDGSYAAIVKSDYLQRTFSIFLNLPGATQVRPLYESPDKLVHCLYLLTQFGTREHSIVYRDQSYLIPKIELEPVFWRTWRDMFPGPSNQAGPSGSRNANRNANRNQNRNDADAGPSGSSNLPNDEPPNANVPAWVFLVTKGSVQRVFLYDPNRRGYTEDPLRIQGYLSQHARGRHAHGMYPRPECVPLDIPEIFRRLETNPPSSGVRVVRFEPEDPFLDLSRSNVFLKKNPLQARYLLGDREIVSDVPTVPSEWVARYPLPDDLPDEPDIRVRYLSCRSACYRPVIAKFLAAYLTYDRNLEVLQAFFAQDREGTYNDTALFFRFVEPGILTELTAPPEPEMIGRSFDGFVLCFRQRQQRAMYQEGQRYFLVETSRGTRTVYEPDLVPERGQAPLEAEQRIAFEINSTVWWKKNGRWYTGTVTEIISRTVETTYVGIRGNEQRSFEFSREELLEYIT